jgi:hypothetical protein
MEEEIKELNIISTMEVPENGNENELEGEDVNE